MKLKTRFAMAGAVVGLALAVSPVLFAQEGFQAPKPPKDVTTTEIPGVVAAGAKWKLVWGGPDNADGLIGYQGGVLFAQEQPNYVGMVDKNDDYSVFVQGTMGAGSLGMDSKGRVLGILRTCTDPGQHPDLCKVPTALAELYPEFKVLTDNDGKGYRRLGDLVVDSKDGVYFNGPEGVFYLSPEGKVTTITDNPRTNGIGLSRDDKTFYYTDRAILMACDVQADGTCANARNFSKPDAGGNGDGIAMDSEGRIYIAAGAPGVEIVSPEGQYLGVIPTPRPTTTVCFSGPDNKTLYIVGTGAVQPNGHEYVTRQGVRNNAKSIYKIDIIAQGFMGRVK